MDAKHGIVDTPNGPALVVADDEEEGYAHAIPLDQLAAGHETVRVDLNYSGDEADDDADDGLDQADDGSSAGTPQPF